VDSTLRQKDSQQSENERLFQPFLRSGKDLNSGREFPLKWAFFQKSQFFQESDLTGGKV
jgi:hypothetical protein